MMLLGEINLTPDTSGGIIGIATLLLMLIVMALRFFREIGIIKWGIEDKGKDEDDSIHGSISMKQQIDGIYKIAKKEDSDGVLLVHRKPSLDNINLKLLDMIKENSQMTKELMDTLKVNNRLMESHIEVVKQVAEEMKTVGRTMSEIDRRMGT
ncbi:MAG TPA: hypothetical protein VEA37_04915 [Flavobacterium sp.]|nr:hypothetical protein [Flavobacterium sp.]